MSCEEAQGGTVESGGGSTKNPGFLWESDSAWLWTRSRSFVVFVFGQLALQHIQDHGAWSAAGWKIDMKCLRMTLKITGGGRHEEMPWLSVSENMSVLSKILILESD